MTSADAQAGHGSEPDSEPGSRGARDTPRYGVRIGRIGGVPVYLAPSWFIVALVIVGIVSGPVLATRPVYGISLGLAQALLLLGSVLVHEAAHALTARGLGMPVLRIVATLWGGHTTFEPGRATPGRMSLVALAGPAANGVLAVASLLAAGVAGDGVVGRLVQGLVIINGSLAVLNILPGQPLDGGQVVECLVWKVAGDRNRGAIVAGWLGRVVAVAVVGWFVVLPMTGLSSLSPDNVWALVVGWVMWSGATSSIRRGEAFGALARLHVRDVAYQVAFLPGDTPAQVALQYPLAVTSDEHGRPTLLLVNDGATHAAALDPTATVMALVTRIPDHNVVEAAPDDQLDAVVGAIGASGFPHVVLTTRGRPWAVVSADRVNALLSRN